jgi:hypothetical protein
VIRRDVLCYVSMQHSRCWLCMCPTVGRRWNASSTQQARVCGGGGGRDVAHTNAYVLRQCVLDLEHDKRYSVTP